jgi:hypothetical protein
MIKQKAFIMPPWSGISNATGSLNVACDCLAGYKGARGAATGGERGGQSASGGRPEARGRGGAAAQ